MSDNERHFIGPQIHSELSHTRLSKLDIFGELRSIHNLQDRGLSVNNATF